MPIVEFTPRVTMDAKVRLPSTWRATGVLGELTDKDIESYMRRGKYGPEAQQRALKRIEQQGRQCVDCGAWGSKSMSFNYLPKCAPYCEVCRKKHRKANEKADAREDYLKRKLKQAMEMYE